MRSAAQKYFFSGVFVPCSLVPRLLLVSGVFVSCVVWLGVGQVMLHSELQRGGEYVVWVCLMGLVMPQTVFCQAELTELWSLVSRKSMIIPVSGDISRLRKRLVRADQVKNRGGEGKGRGGKGRSLMQQPRFSCTWYAKFTNPCHNICF